MKKKDQKYWQERCQSITKLIGDNEYLHIEIDDLMLELLEELAKEDERAHTVWVYTQMMYKHPETSFWFA